MYFCCDQLAQKRNMSIPVWNLNFATQKEICVICENISNFDKKNLENFACI